MDRLLFAAISLLVLAVGPEVQAAQTWTEGEQYQLVQPAQRTTVPAGKVEVLEVFSYGCIACNSFQPIMEKLKSSLPDLLKLQAPAPVKRILGLKLQSQPVPVTDPAPVWAAWLKNGE